MRSIGLQTASWLLMYGGRRGIPARPLPPVLVQGMSGVQEGGRRHRGKGVGMEEAALVEFGIESLTGAPPS